MKKLFFSILIALMASISYSQTSTISSSGTEFDFVFLQNRTMPNGQAPLPYLKEVNLIIYITNSTENTSNVNITYNGTGSFSYKLNNSNNIIPGPSLSFSVSPGQTTTLQILSDESPIENCDYSFIGDMRPFEMMGNNIIQKKAFKITASQPVSIYTESSQPHSRDGSLILPTDILGLKYYIVNYKPDSVLHPYCYDPPESQGGDILQGGGPGEFAILAIENNTHITITFPDNITEISSNMSSNVVIPDSNHIVSLVLNQGEAIQYQSDDFEFTGTLIESDKKIAVFSGNMAVGLPFNSATFDHLYEQLYPVNTWGSKFITVPLRTPYNNNFYTDIYKIISQMDNTKIKLNGQILQSNGNDIILNAGEYLEFVQDQVYKNGDYSNPLTNVTPQFIQSEPNYIEGINDQKIPYIQVVLFNSSCGVNGLNTQYPSDENKLDPFMIVLTPLEQTMKGSIFPVAPELPYTFDNSVPVCDEVKKDYVAIIAKTDETNYIHINDFNGNDYVISNLPDVGTNPNFSFHIAQDWVAVPGTDYSYAIVDVSNDVDIDTTTTLIPKSYQIYEDYSNGSGFNAYVYGYNCRESYGYSAGSGLAEPTSNNITSSQNNYIKITPNPVKETLTINFSLSEKADLLEIKNILGEKVLEKKINYKKGLENLNVKQLEKGVYIISFKNNNRTIENQKFIKL